MKYIKFFLIGIYFGIVLTKAEVISWFRIQEMFHFQSIHMFGIIGSAVVIGAISVFLIKKFNLKSFGGEDIRLISKEYHKGLLPGGIIFGLGWALTGACPGPLFALVGNGVEVMLVAIVSAIAGTFVYGLIKEKLPS
ncbi:DUF6691 family protein [Cytophaga aurantiaca]|uniref:DUF6691 family protein n=1 Tax=Cytophaga aurantiaca TaxID=29530 RepID=UPI00035E886E|nr:DUF6691 family protein [Cytophaga aurantiaca]